MKQKTDRVQRRNGQIHYSWRFQYFFNNWQEKNTKSIRTKKSWQYFWPTWLTWNLKNTLPNGSRIYIHCTFFSMHMIHLPRWIHIQDFKTSLSEFKGIQIMFSGQARNDFKSTEKSLENIQKDHWKLCNTLSSSKDQIKYQKRNWGSSTWMKMKS